MRIAALPLLLFVILGLTFYHGLSLDPQKLPSAKIGTILPDFTLPVLAETKIFSSGALRRQFFVLCVWASWCDACQIEQPFLLQLASKGIHLIGLNYKDKTINAKQWLSLWGNPYEQVLEDKAGKVSIDLGVYGAPETFLISPEGIILYRHVGILTAVDWKKHFIPLMKLRKP